MSLAWLLKRVFEIDMEHCPNCGTAELKIIFAILDRRVIEMPSPFWDCSRSRRPWHRRASQFHITQVEPRLPDHAG